MPLPSFSIVTPSFNQARYLRANIESVLDQDYPRCEHIVIDNASSDGSAEILGEYSSLQFVSEPDRGQSDAVNKAIALSSNDWIVWLNSDDFLLPNALATLAEHIEAHPQSSVIYSNVVHVNERGDTIKLLRPNYSPAKLRYWWWHAIQLWQPGTVFRRNVFETIGPLDITLHYAMDFDFMLKAQDPFPFDHLDSQLVAFRLHAEQKGHANEVPFIDERIAATLSYWRNRNRFVYPIYKTLLFFVRGSLVFVEGLRQLERGNRIEGRDLIRQGLRRNPLAVLRPEHFGFWLRKLVGHERYYRYRP